MSHQINTARYGVKQCVNEDEKFWGKYYLVSFAQCLGWDSAICVNADNEQDAADEAADYAEEKGWKGYFLDNEDLEDYAEDDIITVGNHCLSVLSWELHCAEVRAV
jgi:hypothetical protein